MNDDVAFFRDRLEGFNTTAESVEEELGMSFATIILRQLNALGLTRRDLAQRAGRAESFVSRVLSGDANFTRKTIANLFHAVGLRGRLVEFVSPRDTLNVAPFFKELCTDGPITFSSKKTKATQPNISNVWYATDKRPIVARRVNARAPGIVGRQYVTNAARRLSRRHNTVLQRSARSPSRSLSTANKR